MTVPLTFELGWRGAERSEKPMPLKRLPLERVQVESASPTEVNAA